MSHPHLRRGRGRRTLLRLLGEIGSDRVEGAELRHGLLRASRLHRGRRRLVSLRVAGLRRICVGIVSRVKANRSLFVKAKKVPRFTSASGLEREAR